MLVPLGRVHGVTIPAAVAKMEGVVTAPEKGD
jgi:hypothetical protein